jgi:hypothetical protein
VTGHLLSPLPSLSTVSERLELIFPEGTEHRAYLVRDMAARTIFVLFYLDAVKGTGKWARPDQITRMTDQQSAKTDEAARLAWAERSMARRTGGEPGQWYAGNTREPIRDEVLRNSLRPIGAVVERTDLAKTSSKPRWALAADFAELFTCSNDELPGLVETWRRRHLSAAGLARLALVQQGIAAGADGVLVTFPNGATRLLSPGSSSVIAQKVIEEFAPRFLAEPGVLWVSETSRKDEQADMRLAVSVRLPINPNELLPDIILVDLGYEEPRFVFVEVVSTDGPVTEERRVKLSDMVQRGGHAPQNVAFLTAFMDRGAGVYRKLVPTIAWRSFVWFASEPDKLIALLDAERRPVRLFDLVETPPQRHD